jgi:hypothetical protein
MLGDDITGSKRAEETPAKHMLQRKTRQEFAPPKLPLRTEILDGDHVASLYIPAGDVQKFVCMSRVLEVTISNFVDPSHRSVALITEVHIGHLYLEMSSICRSSSDMH